MDTAKNQSGSPDSGIEMLQNRLRKNLRKLGKWTRQQNIECYRLYDGDLPEYAFAIDCYGKFVHMAEYQAPASIEPHKVVARREQAIQAVQNVLGLDSDAIVLKSRESQPGKQPYQEQSDKSFFIANEGPAQFWINLTDYRNTGLFLDHRAIRRFIRENAAGKRFLNLFCHTASAGVQAVLGGATSSLSIDMSNTYLDWGRKNFLLNKIGGAKHRLKRADCISWLSPRFDEPDKFDLIFLDPPTFSNSKSSDNVLDLQRDHVPLITNTMRKLERGGLLIFATNKRNFKLDDALLEYCKIQDYTHATVDKDFQRPKKIHQSWLISHL